LDARHDLAHAESGVPRVRVDRTAERNLHVRLLGLPSRWGIPIVWPQLPPRNRHVEINFNAQRQQCGQQQRQQSVVVMKTPSQGFGKAAMVPGFRGQAVLSTMVSNTE